MEDLEGGLTLGSSGGWLVAEQLLVFVLVEVSHVVDAKLVA